MFISNMSFDVHCCTNMLQPFYKVLRWHRPALPCLSMSPLFLFFPLSVPILLRVHVAPCPFQAILSHPGGVAAGVRQRSCCDSARPPSPLISGLSPPRFTADAVPTAASHTLRASADLFFCCRYMNCWITIFTS